jgi:hypothetical protein
MFQMLESQNYGLQQLIRLEGFLSIQNHERREWTTHSQKLLYILLPNPIIATIFKPQSLLNPNVAAIFTLTLK